MDFLEGESELWLRQGLFGAGLVRAGQHSSSVEKVTNSKTFSLRQTLYKSTCHASIKYLEF